MAVRKIRIWPDPALSAVARPIERVDDDVRVLVRDLFATLYAANGVGLAANQVGETRRVVVIDVDPHNEGKDDPEIAEELRSWGFPGPKAYINPKIVQREGQVPSEEGCLSVPGVNDTVQRSERVVVEALDEKGEPFTVEGTGLFAIALQHEIDHLNGRVFVEYLSKLKRDVIRRKMERIKLESNNDGVEAAAAL